MSSLYLRSSHQVAEVNIRAFVYLRIQKRLGYKEDKHGFVVARKVSDFTIGESFWAATEQLKGLQLCQFLPLWWWDEPFHWQLKQTVRLQLCGCVCFSALSILVLIFVHLRK